MKNKKNVIPEIIMPKGYELKEVLERDEDDCGDAQPRGTEEVWVRFEG